MFVHPGFEKDRTPAGHAFRLAAHELSKLLAPEEYQTLNALPRIRPRANEERKPRQRFVDLEHARMDAMMMPKAIASAPTSSRYGIAPVEPNAAWVWQFPEASLTGLLPQQQPFRDDPVPSVRLVFLPDEDEEQLVMHRVEEKSARRGETLYMPASGLCRNVELLLGPRIRCWGEHDLLALLVTHAADLDLSLRTCAERMATVDVPKSMQGWRYHPWLGLTKAS